MGILNIFSLLTLFIFIFTQDPGLEESIQRGKGVYEEFCVTCHRGNGAGFGKMYPPLAKSDFLTKNREASIRGVKFGMEGEIMVNGVKYSKKMAPLGLSDEEVRDVMNYVFSAWGNKIEKPVTLQEVASIKKE